MMLSIRLLYHLNIVRYLGLGEVSYMKDMSAIPELMP